MPRKVSFSTLREVTVNIEDTVSEAGEARPPPNACEPNNPRRAGALVYLLLLAALALPWAVTAYAVLYNSGAPPTLAAPPPSRTPPARLLVTEPAHGLVVTPPPRGATAARVRLSLVDYSFALDIASSSSDVIAENEIVFELLAQVLLSTLDSTAPIDLQDQLGVPAEVHLETGGAVVALRPIDVGPLIGEKIDAFIGGGAPGDGRQLSEAAGATSMEGHMPLVLSRLVLENGVLDLAVSRIDPATAAAGGGGYYSYSEP